MNVMSLGERIRVTKATLPGYRPVQMTVTRSLLRCRAGSGPFGGSVHPVQDVAQDRPARLRRPRIAPEDPMVVERGDGPVLLFEIDPVREEPRGFDVVP